MNALAICSLILFPFIFLTSNPMLNPDQAQAIQETYQAYQALKQHCDKHQLDINTLLTTEQKKKMQSGMLFLKTWMPQVKQVMKTMDIPKPTFVEALIQWKDLRKTTFNEFIQTYKEVNFNPQKFVKAMGASSIPILAMLYKEWKDLVNTLPNPSNGETIFKTLQKSDTWIKLSWNNQKGLEKHYNKNKKKYKGIDSNLDDFRDKTLPTKILFENFINASTDPNDPSHPGAPDSTGMSRATYATRIRIWGNDTKNQLLAYKNSEEVSIPNLLILLENDAANWDPFVEKKVYIGFKSFLTIAQEVHEKNGKSMTATDAAGEMANIITGLKKKDIAPYYVYETYKTYQDESNLFINDKVPNADHLLSLIKTASDDTPDDPKKQEFATNLATWKTKVIHTVNDISTDIKTCRVNKDKLLVQLSKLYNNRNNIHTQDYIRSLTLDVYELTEIEDNIQETVRRVTDAVEHLSAINIYDPKTEIDLPDSLGNELKSALEIAHEATNPKHFEAPILEWNKKSDVILTTKYANSKFKLPLLRENLKDLFAITTNGSQNILFLYETMVANLGGDGTISAQSLNNLWNHSLKESKNPSLMAKGYDLLGKGKTALEMKVAIDSLANDLPDATKLESALGLSIHKIKSTPVNKDYNELVVNYNLEWHPAKNMLGGLKDTLLQKIKRGSGIDVEKNINDFTTWWGDNTGITIENAEKWAKDNLNLDMTLDPTELITTQTIENSELSFELPLKIKKGYNNGTIAYAIIDEDSSGFNKNKVVDLSLDFYSLKDAYVGTQGATKYNGNIAISTVEIKLKLAAPSSSTSVSVPKLGSSSQSWNGEEFTLTYIVEVKSTYENGNIEVSIGNSTEPKATDQLKNCSLPTVKTLKLKAFTE